MPGRSIARLALVIFNMLSTRTVTLFARNSEYGTFRQKSVEGRLDLLYPRRVAFHAST
jgi:hypothetical protein